MAWVSTNEIHAGRRMSSDATPKTDYARVFRVECESGDGPIVARFGTGVPQRGDAHPDDADAQVVYVSVEQEDQDDFHWFFLVTCEYSTRIVGPAPNEDDEDNPLAAPIDLSITKEIISLPQEFGWGFDENRDVTVAFTNSAEVPYDPVPNYDLSIPIITVRKNEATFNYYSINGTYQNRVNSLTWNGIPAERVLFMGAQAQRVRTAALTYWEVTYEFKLNPFNDSFPGFPGYDGWITALQDRGYQQREDDGTLLPITDGEGNPVETEVLLDGNGQPLPEGDGVQYLIWHTYPRADLNGLGITLS